MIDNFVIIIGSMKSGTTSLFEYLAQHPEICPSKDKEPEFFVLENKLSKGIGEYEKLWDWDTTCHKYALEASTSYTKIPVFANAAENMKQTNRNFKLIYIIRDPIERIISQLGHTAMVNKTINENISNKVLDNAIQYSSYSKQIHEYSARFGKENILLVKFEDFISEPLLISKKVSKFLSVSENFEYQFIQPKNEKFNIMLFSKFRIFFKIRKLIPGVIKQKVRNFVINNQAYRDYVNKTITQASSLNDEMKMKIKKKLIRDISELQKDYCLDISNWKEWNKTILK